MMPGLLLGIIAGYYYMRTAEEGTRI